MLPFKVAAQYARGPEQLIAKFINQDEAKEYIQSKLEKDVGLRVNITYLLYDMGELSETFMPGQVSGSGAQGGSGSGAGGQQQSSGFRPTPLQTSMRPSGMPPSSFKDLLKDSSDDKKK
jgi:hypothetical protein